MKKIFFLAASMLTAATMSAESVYQWGAGVAENQIGSEELKGTTAASTVKIDTDSKTVNCIAFNNSYLAGDPKIATNYVELTAKEGSFLADDVVMIEFCYNNKQSKVASVAVYDPTDDTELGVSGNGKNGKSENGVSEYTFKLTKEMDKIRIARATTGKTTTCITSLKVVRGEEVVEKPIAPSFSVLGGKYFEPFKVALASTRADKIFYSVNDGEFAEYTDSIEVSQFDVTTKIAAYSMLGELHSDTAVAEYLLTVFVPRTVFNARHTISFAGIQADDVEILDNSVAELTTVAVSGVDYPAVSYIHQYSTKDKSDGSGKEDSTMCISFKEKAGIHFIYKNKENKSQIMRFLPDYLHTEGSNFEIQIDSLCGLVQPNDTIVFVVTAKGSTKPKFDIAYSTTTNIVAYEPEDESDIANYTTGDVETSENARVDEDYCGFQNLVYIVKPSKKAIKIKETKGGFRLAQIQIGAYRGEAPSEEGVENVNASIKAVKRIVNGQVVIVKGDRMFNVLGAEILK